MTGLRRFVYVAQWIVPFVAAIWWFLAPGTGSAGWSYLFIVVLAPVMLVLLYAAAIVTVARRANRRVRMPHAWYAVISVVLWLLLLLMPTGLQGSDDMRTYPSILQDLGVPVPVAGWITLVCIWCIYPLCVAAIAVSWIPSREGAANRQVPSPEDLTA
jgi:hypothetical protein